jgi:putative endonuclease
MDKYYYVYILSNKRNGTLYIGITREIVKRMWQHKEKVLQGFTKEYNVNKLGYYEIFKDPLYAIKREKRIKKYKREWKINIIEKENPEWNDLYDDFWIARTSRAMTVCQLIWKILLKSLIVNRYSEFSSHGYS